MFIISIISYIKCNVNKILHIYIKRLPFAEVFFTYVYSPVKCTTVAVCPTAFKTYQNICCFYFKARCIHARVTSYIFTFKTSSSTSKVTAFSLSFISPITLTEPGRISRYSSIASADAKESLAELI